MRTGAVSTGVIGAVDSTVWCLCQLVEMGRGAGLGLGEGGRGSEDRTSLREVAVNL